ncbi:hypothetical protein ACFV1C_40600, partial [Streptomyces sp. NPDC059605]|uniref:hypothetical protein n=1 Tax=Streptomyces sp. NPDC059605 TaxID=3346882 RepID=UPI00368534E7
AQKRGEELWPGTGGCGQGVLLGAARGHSPRRAGLCRDFDPSDAQTLVPAVRRDGAPWTR